MYFILFFSENYLEYGTKKFNCYQNLYFMTLKNIYKIANDSESI